MSENALLERATAAAEERHLSQNTLMARVPKIFLLRMIRPSTTQAFVSLLLLTRLTFGQGATFGPSLSWTVSLVSFSRREIW
jgi:hypothetical protein